MSGIATSRRLAALEEAATQEVAVKALEWAEYGDRSHAYTIAGDYSVKHDGDEPEEWSLRRDGNFGNGCGFFTSEAAAKAAAQADFESRIRTALSTPLASTAAPEAEGWKMVPVEPTNKMLMCVQQHQAARGLFPPDDADEIRKLWAALLSASPVSSASQADTEETTR